MDSVGLACLFLVIAGCAGKPQGAEKALYEHLLAGYRAGSRPVIDPNQTVSVNVSIVVSQLLDLDELSQVLTVMAVISHSWYDDYLTWDPRDYGAMQMTYLPCQEIWLPDTTLYNTVDDADSSFMPARVSVHHTGLVRWYPLAKIKTSCQLDIKFYPFDYQKCHLRIGSWSYTVKQVDLRDGGRTDRIEVDYIDSGELELLRFLVTRSELTYGCCAEPLAALDVAIVFKRRPLFTLFTLAAPCTLLSLISVVSFLLPTDSEAKLEVQLSVILSLAVFMLLLGQSTPPTSHSVPLIGIHLVILMSLMSLSLVCSVLVLNLVNTDHTGVSPSLKRVVYAVARMLCVGQREEFKASRGPADSWRCQHTPSITPSSSLRETTKFELLSLVTPTTDGAGDDSCPARDGQTDDAASLYRNLSLIADYVRERHSQERCRTEWLFVGTVVDRLLLLLLALMALLVTVYLYTVYPLREELMQS